MSAVHLQVEEWVDRQPGACAVREASSGRELTFQQLWQRSGVLAGRLRAQGVQRGDFVGVAMPRSAELIVGMLGILRAGAAYLPLDVHAPADRLAVMLVEANVDLVVEATTSTGPGAARGWPLPDGLRRISVPAPPVRHPTDADNPDRVPPGRSRVEGIDVADWSPAYVAYTSGSAGRPKGVVVPHRAVAALVTSPDYCTITPGDRVAGSANPAFDATTFEVWGTLAAGGTLVILPAVTDVALDIWVDAIRTEHITTMFLTTSLFHLVARERPTAFRRLHTLIVGGEQLDLAAARRVLSAGPPRRLVNAYGPTETTTFATWFDCTVGSLAGCDRVPIGYPLQHTVLHVLDEELRPVRPGEAGELCIGGTGLALGYLGRPELTAEKFVAGPTAAMYRTGDLVRALPGGALEMLGRRDRQVKLRGFRIELEEIERAAVDTGLAASAFVEKVGQSGAATLIGFVFPAPSAPPEPAELAAKLSIELARRLPEYMLPARWNVLAEVPIGASGKADRGALAAHVLTPGRPVDPLRDNDIPELIHLREVCQDVLGLAEVDDRETFIALGGNSILAIQAVSRARDRWGIELAVGDLLGARSLAELAAPAGRRTVTHFRPAHDTLRPRGVIPTSAPVPLSPAQERLFFLQQLVPDSVEYNVPVVLRLRGRPDEHALQSALATVIGRHDILRSRFTTSAGRPELVTDPTSTVRIRIHDLAGSDLSNPTHRRSVDRALATATGKPFDLASGPCLRADLLQLGGGDHLLALTFHHLVFDGWSVGILLRELDACYAAERTAETPVLPALPIQFHDYAARQRDPAGAVDIDRQVGFWFERLRGATPLQLPVDDPTATARSSGPGGGVPFALPEEVAQGVLRLSRERGTTPFATLLAGFQVLLSRHTGQHDVVVAVPMAGRADRDTLDLIGFFVNTTVLRADLTGNPRFTDLLTRTMDSLVEGLAHQDAPFDRIVHQLHPARDLHRNPLAQVMFGARETFPGPTPNGLAAERYEWGQGSAGFELAVEVEVSAGGIRGRVDFPPGLFGDPTVRLLVGHYQALLAALVADPLARVEELPLHSGPERAEALSVGNGERRPVPGEGLHDLLSERAAAWPEAVALEGDGERLTYRQLEQRAGDIAGRLCADGIGPGSVVAVLLPRGPALVAGLLGVLRTGAAYLPLDPGQPRARLATVLADAGARFALTDQRLSPLLDDLPITVLPGSAPGPAGAAAVRRQSGGASAPAYVIFTSGSTGRPKPVVVPHRALVNHAVAMAELFGLGPSDRVLQFAGAGFDVFAEEVFPTLLAGARVVFPGATAQPVPSIGQFRTALQLGAITVVNLPSGFWAQWAKDVLASDAELPASLRLVVIGSEPADGRLLERWRRHCAIPVANVYGVSEATVSTTALVPARATASGRVPVGHPIPNTAAHVLDAALRPLPPGVVGELFIGGHGVALGYAGRPDLTAERFVPDPSGHPGSRLYRTGDLARRLPSGSLDVLGRMDQQVKIRGLRIELGEIESHLAEYVGVGQAAVTPCADAHGDTRLVAYLVCTGDPPVLSDLRRFLRDRLPENMLPALFVVLERLPLTTGGKLDRAALPAPEDGHLAGERTYRAPTTATETALAAIWEDLLGQVCVGLDDDFFELGGHSLLATRVVSRVRERLSQELPLVAIFQAPTIAALAAVLDASPDGTRRSTAPPLRRTARATYRVRAGQLDLLLASPTIGDSAHAR